MSWKNVDILSILCRICLYEEKEYFNFYKHKMNIKNSRYVLL